MLEFCPLLDRCFFTLNNAMSSNCFSRMLLSCSLQYTILETSWCKVKNEESEKKQINKPLHVRFDICTIK